ncbi:ArsR family transcriptional regulator [Candidatus Bathyarchaeota archaeon]|nr:MAG: ArsR family transcriptional regulator [Candidatus Bathyarchaeota archaeon]
MLLGSLTRMQATKRTIKSDKRLERLICSGLRPTKDLEKYAAELKQLAEKLADPDFLRRKSRLLKSLANETRLKMLMLLTIREMCVCELTVALDLTQPTASHHLNILQNVGLVKDRKEGKWVFYSVAKPEVIQDLFDFLGFPQ